MRTLKQEDKKALWDYLGVRPSFNAYGWMETNDLKISKDDHWYGWFNDSYSYLTIFPKTMTGLTQIEDVRKIYLAMGWKVTKAINRGIGLSFDTMTPEEVDAKADSNLVHGGRMSD